MEIPSAPFFLTEEIREPKMKFSSNNSNHSLSRTELMVVGSGTYATTDLSLSAFLQSIGHKILDIQKTGRRGVFVFEDCQELRADILSWGNNQPVSIRLRSFVNSLRDLKGLISM